MSFPIVPRARRHLALWSVLALLFVSGCATVRVAQVSDADYLAQRRADVLTGGHPSASTRATPGMSATRSTSSSGARTSDANTCAKRYRS